MFAQTYLFTRNCWITAIQYHNKILRPIVFPFIATIFVDDNTQLHRLFRHIWRMKQWMRDLQIAMFIWISLESSLMPFYKNEHYCYKNRSALLLKVRIAVPSIQLDSIILALRYMSHLNAEWCKLQFLKCSKTIPFWMHYSDFLWGKISLDIVYTKIPMEILLLILIFLCIDWYTIWPMTKTWIPMQVALPAWSLFVCVGFSRWWTLRAKFVQWFCQANTQGMGKGCQVRTNFHLFIF